MWLYWFRCHTHRSDTYLSPCIIGPVRIIGTQEYAASLGLKYIFILFFNSLIYVCISVESGNWDCKYCKHDMVVWWTLIHMVFFFSRHIYPITCSSDQATDLESTNPEFVSRKWVLFTLKLAYSINNLCLFWFSNKNKFWGRSKQPANFMR